MTSLIALSDWPRLLALVEQALELPAAEREAWLQGLGLTLAMEAALRKLLADRRAIETGDFLAALPMIASAAPPSAAAGPFSPGSHVGPWRLLRELGQGGMSVVWLAERLDGQIERRVALKLPHAGPGQELLARRMLRERKILAALEHPHIARLYDVGLTDGGTPYLVMEYVEGENLLAFADARQLELRQRLALFQQVLGAVQFAHGKLVLHRDLKPGNILVSARGPAGEVKLLDFGIAKLMAAESESPESPETPGTTELTRAADRRLTPSHASPEQLRGEVLGTASDVYSLGVILYELLCGQRPHGASGGSVAQLEAEVLQAEARAPSRRTPADAALKARATSAAVLARTLRGDLDAIVLKALAKAPGQRYASAEALAADLGRWLAGETVTARSPGAWYYAGKLVQRHRWAVGLGSAAAAALIVASTAALVQSRAAQQEAARASTARDFLLQLFEEAAPDRLKGVQLTAKELLEQGRQKAQAQLGGQPRLQAELLAGIGETQYEVGDMTRAEAALQQAAGYFMKAGDRPREAAARIRRLQIAVEDGDGNAVEGLLRDLQPLAATVKQEPLLHLRWLNAQGHHANYTQNPPEAKRWFGQAIALADASQPEQAAVAFDSRLGLSFALMLGEDFQAAQAQLKAAEQMPAITKLLPAAERLARLAMSRAYLDAFQDHIGHLLGWLPTAIAACEEGLGRFSVKCGALKSRRLRLLLLSGDSDQFPQLDAELDHWLQQTTSLGTAWDAALLGSQAMAVNGHAARALAPVAALEKLVRPGPDNPLPLGPRVPIFVTLAEIRLRAGDAPGALAWLARAADGAERAPDFSERDRQEAWQHIGLGRGLVKQAQGKHEEALESMGDLCHRSQQPVKATLMRLNCVRSLAAAGRAAEAIALARDAVPVLEQRLGTGATHTVRARELLSALEAPGGYRPPPWQASQIFYAF